MKILVDRRIYSDSCISKAIYSLADRLTVGRIVISDAEEELDITPKTGSNIDYTSINSMVLDALNDYKLRDTIEKETHDIRVILYAKAFGDFDDLEDENVE